MVYVAAWAEEPNVNLSGVYDDEGKVVISSNGRSADGVSLHALLKLEFLPALARVLHEQTAEVRIKHSRAALEIEVFDFDGKVSWSGGWKQGDGYALREGRAILHFKPGKYGQDEYLLMFRNITVHRLLEVEVQRLKPTVLGPSIHPVGTYLFPRLPEETDEGGKR